MRALPEGWKRALQNPSSKKIILLTINFSGAHALGTPHLATKSRSFRFATQKVDVLSSFTNLKYPFLPYLLETPEVTESFSQHERRFEISQTTLRISGAAGINDLFDDYDFGVTARLDLYSPSIPNLERTFLLAAGVLTSPVFERSDSMLQIDLIDSGADIDVTYPPEPYSLVDFGDAPDRVIGARSPQTIVGPFPRDIRADPVNERDDGKSSLFCLATGGSRPVTKYPDVVKVNGTQSSDYTIRDYVSESGKTYVLIQFNTWLDNGSIVTASGGVGITENNPILFLLDFAQRRLISQSSDGNVTVDFDSRAFVPTSDALNLLRDWDAEDFSVIWNSSGSVKQIIENLLLQTDIVPGFKYGQFDAIRVLQRSPESIMSLGRGLWFRLPNVKRTDQYVFNNFELLCGRKLASSSDSNGAPEIRIPVNKDEPTTDPRIRDILARSVRRYGTRPQQVNLLDLNVQRNDKGVAVDCEEGRIVGNVLAIVHSFVPRPHRYFADWYRSFSMRMNQVVKLTDSTQRNVDNLKTRLSSRSITVTGPFLTFENHRGEVALDQQ